MRSNQNDQETELEEYKTEQQYQSSLKYRIEEPQAITNLPPDSNNQQVLNEQQIRMEERRRLEAGRDRTLTLGRAPENPNANVQAAPTLANQAIQTEAQQEQIRRDMELAREAQEGNDMITDQHVTQTKSELRLIGAFNAICGIAFTAVMFMQTDQIVKLAKAKGQRQVMFAITNCLLYIVTAIQAVYIVSKVDQDNLRMMKCRHQLATFVVFLFTFSGIGIVWSKEMQELEKMSGNQLKPIITLLNWMVWVRLAPIIMQFVILIFVCCFICGHIAMGRRDLHERTEERLNRLPGVKQFLKTRSRSFKPSTSEKDQKIAKENEGCAICLENYAEGDNKEIVELQCGHIFHAKCMEAWVENNDICPMCREPILSKK